MQADRLNDVCTDFVAGWGHLISQQLVQRSGKGRGLNGRSHHRRRKEQSHKQRTGVAQCAADLFAHAGRTQTLGAHIHILGFSCNIAAGWRDAAARIFNQRTDDEVSTDLGRLLLLHEFSVAVVHHNDGFRVDRTHQTDNPLDVLHKQRWTQRITAGTLDVSDLRTLDCLRDALIVDLAVLEQVQLLILHTEILERTADLLLLTQPDDAMQSVIRQTGQADHPVARAQNAEQGNGQCVGAGHKVITNQRILAA